MHQSQPPGTLADSASLFGHGEKHGGNLKLNGKTNRTFAFAKAQAREM
jgi:hypothetical protein